MTSFSSEDGSCRYIWKWLGNIDYAEPEKLTPWTGISVAFASLVCVLAMAVDVGLSFRSKQTWVPPKLLALDAAMITFLGMAAETPNSPGVPVVDNQIMKLGGMVLMGAAMYHSVPALYLMSGGSLLSSMIALFLVLLSSTIKTWYQFFSTLHGRFSPKILFTSICAAYTVVLLLMYLLLVSLSLGVSTVKEILEKKYSSKHKTMVQEVQDKTAISTQILRRYLRRYLLMAFTSNPEFVMFRSGVSGLFAMAFMLINMLAILLCLVGWGLTNCSAVGATFVIQCVALDFVLLLSFIRGISLKRFSSGKKIYRFSHAERHMLHKIEEWKKIPFPIRLKSRKTVMVVARSAKFSSLLVLVAFQRTVAFLTLSLFVVIAIAVVICYLPLFVFLCVMISREKPAAQEETPNGILSPQVLELAPYILQLEDDNEYAFSINYTIQQCAMNQNRWIKNGEGKQPKQLHRLLIKHLHNNHPMMMAPKFGRSWCLRLATLECIIRVASHRSRDDDDGNEEWALLEEAVDECFSYAVIVDGLHTRLLLKEASRSMRELLENFVKKFSRWSIREGGFNPTASKEVEAAKMVREGLLLDEEWQGVPLRNPLELNLIEALNGEAEQRMNNLCEDGDREDWPLEAFAAESMKELTDKMLTDPVRFSYNELEGVTARVMASCLRELPLAIFLEFSGGSYGKREKHVELAARVLGETSQILEFLEQADNPSSSNNPSMSCV